MPSPLQSLVGNSVMGFRLFFFNTRDVLHFLFFFFFSDWMLIATSKSYFCVSVGRETRLIRQNESIDRIGQPTRTRERAGRLGKWFISEDPWPSVWLQWSFLFRSIYSHSDVRTIPSRTLPLHFFVGLNLTLAIANELQIEKGKCFSWPHLLGKISRYEKKITVSSRGKRKKNGNDDNK